MRKDILLCKTVGLECLKIWPAPYVCYCLDSWHRSHWNALGLCGWNWKQLGFRLVGWMRSLTDRWARHPSRVPQQISNPQTQTHSDPRASAKCGVPCTLLRSPKLQDISVRPGCSLPCENGLLSLAWKWQPHTGQYKLRSGFICTDFFYLFCDTSRKLRSCLLQLLGELVLCDDWKIQILAMSVAVRATSRRGAKFSQ